MSDFAQRIMRAVFEEPFSRLQGSIRTVLKMHQADGEGHCGECGQPTPCPTVSTFANSLGVREDPED